MLSPAASREIYIRLTNRIMYNLLPIAVAWRKLLLSIAY